MTYCTTTCRHVTNRIAVCAISQCQNVHHVLQHEWRDRAWRAAWQVPGVHPTRLGWSCPPQEASVSWVDAHPPSAIIWLWIGTWTSRRPSHYQGNFTMLEKLMLMKYKSIQCQHKVLLQVINWKYVISEMPGWFCCKHAMARLHTWLCWQLITLLVTHSISIHWGIHWLLDMTHAVP